MPMRKTKPKAKQTKVAEATRKPGKPQAAGRGKTAAVAAEATGPDWREATLARVRSLIEQADAGIVEERKWKKPSNAMAGVPVWSCPSGVSKGDGGKGGGIICTGETYKAVVKLTFAKGASLPDPSGLFNASLEGNMRRAIDIAQDHGMNAAWEAAFKSLIKAAVAQGALAGKPDRAPRAGATAPAAGKKGAAASAKAKPVKLLAGGNPQMAKGDGDGPVQEYIALMSGGGAGWQRDIGRRLDDLIVRTVPDVRKAVRWNSPFYGIKGEGEKPSWFLSFHVCTRYVKVAFFRGSSLRPLPPEASTQAEVRYLHIHKEDRIDEAQLAAWVKQAAALPGWVP